MSRQIDLLLAASAPVVWGSTYIVTTQMLPDGYPITVSALRALPAGILLLLISRQFPPVNWLAKLLLLGAMNFSIFWIFLFIAAYRLPGGLAATLGAIQPLIVLVLARVFLATPFNAVTLISALAGFGGVGLLLYNAGASFDLYGILAALGSAISMGFGVVLTRKWKPPVDTLTFTSWQLIAGGILLIPIAIYFEPNMPELNLINLSGLVWIGLFGAAISYLFWFRGIERLGPTIVTSFGFLSPLTAVILGWVYLGETLSPVQLLGALIIVASIWTSTMFGAQKRASVKPA